MASTDIRDGVSEGAALVRLEKQQNKISGARGARGAPGGGERGAGWGGGGRGRRASRYFISYFIFKKP